MERLKKTGFAALIFCISQFSNYTNAQQISIDNNSLNEKQKSIVIISSFTANGDVLQLKSSLNDGLNAGFTINEIKEVLVQLYAYTGFPRSLNALNTLMAVLKERKANGINDPEGAAAAPLPAGKTKLQFGTEMQTKLVGQPVKGAVYEFAPAIDQFLKEHLFADIFGRNNLDWKTRELVTIAALATLGNVEAQLRSHFNVGMYNGLTEAQLIQLVSIINNKIGVKEGDLAKAVLKKVLSKEVNIPKIKTKNDTDVLFPKGIKVTNNNFTGTVWLHMLLNADTTLNINAGNVTFEAGARTSWHYHPGGQLLLVTSGKGRYQEKGKPVKEIRKGDMIECKPNIIHWHGAAPDNELSHIAIGTNQHKGAVVWLQPTSDEEYNKL
jgi:4-carboxymuconolactone decarboxylase